LATLTQIAPPVKKRRAKPTNRDILAHLFMAAWLCVILQGALRKWVAPGAGFLYLLQDVPLVLAYVYALWKGLIWGGKLAWMCLIVSFVLALHTMLQLIFVDLRPRTAIIGLHQYVFYLPILFLAPVCYNHKNRERFIRWNMLIIVPMSLIAALQSRAPAAAWINRTSNGEDTGLGGIGIDKVRATGTFNFTVTYAIWCGFAVGLVLGEWLSPPSRRIFKSKAMLLLCTMGAIVAPLVSGSRLAVLLAGLAFVGGFVSVIVTRNVRLILRFSAVVLLLPILVVVGYYAAPTSFQAVLDRFSGEGAQQEMGSRVEKMVTAFSYASRYSVLGVGIGYGIPAANPGANAFNLSENESIRIIGELGTYTGVAVIAVRYICGVLLFFACIRALQLPRGHALPHALPLMFTMAPTLAVGELTSAAPVVATQLYFWIAIILSALLFRREPIEASLLQMSKTR
jgi:hypothetical protein